MTIRILYTVVGILTGLLIGLKISPIHRIWEASLVLAAESARKGCMEANGGYARCTRIGKARYNDLRGIHDKAM